MKYIKVLGLIMLIFFFSSCQKDPEDIIETPVDIQNDQEHMEIKKILRVYDYINEYNFDTELFDTHKDDRYPGISFVDVEEFLSLLSPGINTYSIEKGSSLTITAVLYGADEGEIFDEYSLSIDPTLNLLIYDDFNFYQALSRPGYFSYTTDLVMTEFETSDNAPGLTIDLNDYGMDILYREESYYIPLELANLILTSYSLNVYQMGDGLYIIDDEATLLEIIDRATLESKEADQPLIDFTYRFSALLFDYFYGLKDFQHVTSYLEKFEDKSLDQKSTFVSFDNAFYNEVLLMDDLHTQILDFGLDREDVNPTGFPTTYSRIREYVNAYVKHCELYETQDFKWIDNGDYYILELNAFKMELKDQLEKTIGTAEPGKPIYIDLTCNSGGYIISAIELLSYMTNDPIEITYKNATTDVIYHETYESTVDKKVDNPFIVLTTKATYSAANVFTSIVKDMDLGIIVGRSTLGGAAAVRTTILPNQLIMTYSSPMVLLNQAHEMIENGVKPHVEVSVLYNRDQYIEESMKIYQNIGIFLVDNESTLNEFKLLIDTTASNSNLDLITYTFEYIDGLTDHVLYTQTSTELDVAIDQQITVTSKLVKIRITANYTYHGITMDEVIYVDYVDELPSAMSEDTFTLSLDQIYYTTKHNDLDIDYLRVMIEETDAYKLSVVSGSYTDNESNMYNESGDRVSGSGIYILEPGVYYIEVDLDRLDFQYSIRLSRMNDDNVGGTEIHLTEGITSVTLYYDFPYDEEWVVFTLDQTMKVKIYSDAYVSSDYYIADSEGRLYHHNADYLLMSEREEALLEPGTYMVKFHRDVESSRSYTIKFESTPLSGDVSGDKMLTQASYEPLIIGDMTVLFEAKWDRDIYQFTTEQKVDLQFFRDQDVTVCEITSPGVADCKWESELFTLEPGTHYFMFETLSHEDTYSVNIHVEMLMDLSDENNKIPVEIGVPFEAIIERDGDLDYYTFEVTEHQHIEFDVVDGHSASAEIYNSQGDMIYKIYYGYKIIELIPGSYVIVIGENISLADEVYHFIVNLNPYITDDQDPAITDFPEEMYRQFTPPFDYEGRAEGSLDYEDDVDCFILNVTTPGNYKFSVVDSTKIIAYLYDSEGNSTRLFNGYHYDLVEGIYYIEVYSQYSDLDYFFYMR
jgi:hypothetical protein